MQSSGMLGIYDSLIGEGLSPYIYIYIYIYIYMLCSTK